MESSVAAELRAEVEMFCSLLDDKSSPQARTSAAAYFRRYYSMTNIDEDPVLNGMIVERLMKLTSSRYDPNRKMCAAGRLDAAWALTNVVCQSNDLCHLVAVEKDGVKLLADVASKESYGSELKMQCYWALGNIAADCERCKRAIRETNIMLLLGHSINDGEFSSKEAAKNVLWCTMNVVRGGGVFNTPLEAVYKMANGCSNIIHQKKNLTDQLEYVKNAIWIIAHLADDLNNGGSHIEVISGMQMLVEDLMGILMRGPAQLQSASLRVLGNIATGNTEQTDGITRHPLFYEMLVKFLGIGGSLGLSHEAAWLASNCAAGSDEQLEILFTDNRLYDRVLCRLKIGETRMKKECAWTIINMLAGATESRHEWLISTGVISAFETILDLEDTRIVTRGLNALVNILTDWPHYAIMVKEELFLEKIKPGMLQEPDIVPRLEEIKRIIMKQVDDKEDGEATIVFI